MPPTGLRPGVVRRVIPIWGTRADMSAGARGCQRDPHAPTLSPQGSGAVNVCGDFQFSLDLSALRVIVPVRKSTGSLGHVERAHWGVSAQVRGMVAALVATVVTLRGESRRDDRTG